MKKVVVLGGGFAGVAALMALQKKTKNLEVELELIDKNSFHLFTPSLYEVATSEEPRKNIAIPFAEIFGKNVKLTKSRIERVDKNSNTIVLGDGSEVVYDYLIISLGSEPSYFGIPGLKENALDLKTLDEAVRIRDQVKKVVLERQSTGEKAKIIVGGGGFSGTELAAELITYRERLAKENKVKEDFFDLAVVEGMERLLNGLDPNVSKLAQEKLEKKGIKLYLNCFIKEVNEKQIEAKDGQTIDFDLLIWTGGVAASGVLGKSNFTLTKRGQLEVENSLLVKGENNVFAIGDVASFLDSVSKKPAPTVAQVAEEEGKIAGENVVRALNGEKLINYKLRHFGYVVPLKGKYVIAELGFLELIGWIAWVVQQLVFLRYLLGILSFPKAFQRWNRFEIDLKQE